jgi:hypothetical protein
MSAGKPILCDKEARLWFGNARCVIVSPHHFKNRGAIDTELDGLRKHAEAAG